MTFEADVRRASPWEISPGGVVSLLEMLEFSAREYAEITYLIGLVVAKTTPEMGVPDFGVVIGKLVSDSNRLGLTVTRDAVWRLIDEMAGVNPGRVKVHKQGDQIRLEMENCEIADNRLCHHAESVYNTLRSELSAISFKAIPKEKARFTDPQWLLGSMMYKKYPETVDEFQRAGRCYAYGENTACVFHLMRVTDFYLKKVAESIGEPYDSSNWHGIGSKITKSMEKKYQLKTDEWKQKEPFLAEILTDIQAIGRAHRNPALHQIDKKYEERDAAYMLTVIEQFGNNVARQL